MGLGAAFNINVLFNLIKTWFELHIEKKMEFCHFFAKCSAVKQISHSGKSFKKCKILSSGIHLAGIQCSIVVHDVENRRHHVFLSGKLSFSIPNCSPVFHQCTVEGISITFCKCETPWNLRFLKPHTNIRLGFFHSGSWEGGDLLCDELRVRAHLASFHHHQMFLYPTSSVPATPPHGTFNLPLNALFFW